jgi:hypothetical protein
LDFDAIQNLIADAEGAKVALDLSTLEYTLRMKLERMAEAFQADPANTELLAGLGTAVGVARSLPLDMNLAKIQNICYDLLQAEYKNVEKQKAEGGQHSTEWIDRFRPLAEKLSLYIAS